MVDYAAPERAVCGAILIDAACLPVIRERVSAADFRIEPCRAIFRAACELSDGGKVVDPVTIAQAAGADTAFCIELMDTTPTAANAGEYAALVHKNAQLQKLGELGEEIQTSARQTDADPAAIAAAVDNRINDIMSGTGKAVTTPEAALAFFQHRKAIDEGKAKVIRSGFPALDGILGGFAPGGLYIVGARPAIGKTAFGLALGDMLAREMPVLFASLEMSIHEITARRLSSLTGIGYNRLLYGSMEDRDYTIVAEAMTALSARQMDTLEAAGQTVEQIGLAARSAAVLIIDYMGLIQCEGKTEYERVTNVSMSLKRLAMGLHIPVIALCQLNREALGQSGHRPALNNLRSSGSIEQDADAVLLLHRPGYYAPPPERPRGNEAQAFEIEVAKNRHGATGQARLEWIAGNNRFIDRREDGGNQSWMIQSWK